MAMENKFHKSIKEKIMQNSNKKFFDRSLD